MQRAAVIGGYVSQSQERNAHATAAMGESPIELMQARSALEGSVVTLACARATADALLALRHSVDEMRAAIARSRRS